MRIIFFGLWLITIVAGSILGTIVPPSAVYLTGFTAGSLRNPRLKVLLDGAYLF